MTDGIVYNYYQMGYGVLNHGRKINLIAKVLFFELT